MEAENGGLRTEVGGRPEGSAATRREAVCRALTEAHGCCPLLYESRATSHEPRVSPPCCGNCAYAVPLQDGSRQLLVCTKCPMLLTRMRVTDPADCCELFRVKRQPTRKTVPPEPPDQSIRYIPLTKGKYATIDAADYERAASFSWHVSISGNRTYAYSNINGRNISLHRFLMNAPKGLVVDHIDHDGLNDRRNNLRICTQRQNLYNSRPKGRSSRFKGVCWDKAKQRWVVYIRHNGRNRFVGQFADEVEAARAYDRAAHELFGEYAYLNFPEEIEGPTRKRAG